MRYTPAALETVAVVRWLPVIEVSFLIVSDEFVYTPPPLAEEGLLLIVTWSSFRSGSEPYRYTPPPLPDAVLLLIVVLVMLASVALG